MEALFIKSPTGLAPACEEAREWLSKKKLGATIMVEPREMRNGKFFKKWFALIEMAYSYWAENVQPMEFKGRPVLPSFDRFRKDLTIWAGYYEPVVNLKGEVRIEALSIAWASMDEEKFAKLYDATIQVLLAKVFNGKVCQHWSEEQLRRVSGEVLEFAA
jgi:hypothetical protein